MKKLRAFVLLIKQERSHADSMKNEYDESQGIALAEAEDEEAVETLLLRSFADGSKAISGFFVETSG